MKLALNENGSFAVGEHSALFPGTSFPESGPNAAFTPPTRPFPNH